ncbi:hypothetical protein [Micromonospora sp. WMMD1082]|uniref:hypothetical protein n=1 Tax=Micromonospora sp. WMMD1082 TaxID=3016104 RepID=UPI002417CA4B|nr:hypothetical protein [Micromonospora sp. WMMD1082]MDG4797643.1 hypothetical protein [Micromonospora sp. WMMD1082]
MTLAPRVNDSFVTDPHRRAGGGVAVDSSPPPPPEVAPGTLLRLAPGDWSYGRDLTPGTPVAVTVTSVRDLPNRSEEWVWVLGHRPECAYPHVDRHPPCMEVRVAVTALRGRDQAS